MIYTFSGPKIVLDLDPEGISNTIGGGIVCFSIWLPTPIARNPVPIARNPVPPPLCFEARAGHLLPWNQQGGSLQRVSEFGLRRCLDNPKPLNPTSINPRLLGTALRGFL